MFDDWGETLGGLADSMVTGSQQVMDSWFDNESEKVRSAAPEEQRPTQQAAVQPNGQPVAQRYALGLTPAQALMGLAVVGGLFFLATKKG